MRPNPTRCPKRVRWLSRRRPLSRAFRMTLSRDLAGGQPESSDKVALGEKLFFDGRLSADGTVACATCHDPQKGFTDQHVTSIGIRGQKGQAQRADGAQRAVQRHAVLGWPRRQARGSGQAADLQSDRDGAKDRPTTSSPRSPKSPNIEAAFQKVFGRPVNYDDLARAIAAYERAQAATALASTASSPATRTR